MKYRQKKVNETINPIKSSSVVPYRQPIVLTNSSSATEKARVREMVEIYKQNGQGQAGVIAVSKKYPADIGYYHGCRTDRCARRLLDFTAKYDKDVLLSETKFAANSLIEEQYIIPMFEALHKKYQDKYMIRKCDFVYEYTNLLIRSGKFTGEEALTKATSVSKSVWRRKRIQYKRYVGCTNHLVSDSEMESISDTRSDYVSTALLEMDNDEECDARPSPSAAAAAAAVILMMNVVVDNIEVPIVPNPVDLIMLARNNIVETEDECAAMDGMMLLSVSRQFKKSCERSCNVGKNSV